MSLAPASELLMILTSTPVVVLMSMFHFLLAVRQCFEGIKAFRCKDGQVRIFRPDANAQRLRYSADLACMAPVPENLFVKACERAVANNLEFVPPYGSGGAMYIRPLLLGTGPEIGLYPAPEFTFIVMVIPVGNFYKSGVKPVDCLVVDDFDRGMDMHSERSANLNRVTQRYTTYD